MDIRELLTKEDIDKILGAINDYKILSESRWAHPYKLGLCEMISRNILIKPYKKGNKNDNIDDIIESLAEIDGIPKEDIHLDDYVEAWGSDMDVPINQWYCKRIGVLLKARDIITGQIGEYYV